ncbi:MAG: hypothetical protein NW237_08765 [Cyanobacteriota bacterium]|nr:hypothetical protein [Cyanobacteriota bacterium]
MSGSVGASPRSTAFWSICRRVYLVWAVIVLGGFVATHFYQAAGANWFWLILSLMGLGYMMRQTQLPEFHKAGLAHLFYVAMVWTLTIALGMVISVIPFLNTNPLTPLSLYLGAFWLFQMGTGHLLNGMVDPPRQIYWLTGGLQYVAGGLCLGIPALLSWQYLLAGVVGGLAMILLIVLRR